MDARLRAVCDLMVEQVREQAGLHEYDGHVQDLSPGGIRAGLAELGGPSTDTREPTPPATPPHYRVPLNPTDSPGLHDSPNSPSPSNSHDLAHLHIFETALHTVYGDLEMHRRNPLPHLLNLDLCCYDREYAPAADRDRAKRAHLASWPDAIDASVRSLDRVDAPTARAVLDTADSLTTVIPPELADTDIASRARRAHGRLMTCLRHAADHGDPGAALGERDLALLMGAPEGLDVSVPRLAERADQEAERLRLLLREACHRLAPGRRPYDLVRDLVREHPPADAVLDEARAVTAELMDFTRGRGLLPHLDGEVLVGPTPPSRQDTWAMMAFAAPGEPDSPSWYHITLPGPGWKAEEAAEWLAVFSPAMLPAVTAHEVVPGHFAHARCLRRAAGPVRRTLQSLTFMEGWAHYGEELMMEEGYRAADPRFAIGVCMEALIRVTRLACAIGVHTGAMDVPEAARRFEADTYLSGRAARSEAERATYDPTYGRYTWGKLALRDVRDEARHRWGDTYSPFRFHSAVLALGSPPLGLLPAALTDGGPQRSS
ncbi:DUF885 family protein [Streptomyces sp. NPDC059788]|uniref:DUF885 family protein n=1 Tax=Streptomyces sp. NPDC059788 TaxID=3346948 RepID=UPI0036589210